MVYRARNRKLNDLSHKKKGMKRNLNQYGYFLFPVMGVILFLVGCKKDTIEIQYPTISTVAISAITVNSAQGTGTIISNGGEAIAACGLCWALNSNPSVIDYKTSETPRDTGFTSNLNNLISDTVYYVRAYARNSAGFAYGKVVAFRTLKKTTPEVATKEATEITSGACKLDAEITKQGYGTILACDFCWDVNENPTIGGNKSSNMLTGNTFTVGLDGLLPETTYYVRAYATNRIGTAYGNQVVVKTLAVAEFSTIALTASSSSTITASVSITSDFGTAITENGFCWSTDNNPTIANSYAAVGKGTGVYSYEIGHLSPLTNYYIRAYARNKYGVMYGTAMASKTLQQPGTVVDASGNIYKCITIGSQTWMGSDLKTAKYSNGDVIPDFVSSTSTIGTAGTYYTNVNYGKFYNWYATIDPRNIAPIGWHVATDADWTLLENFIGGISVAGGKLKEAVEYWFQPNAATDAYGFKALPTGYRFADGSYATSGFSMGYWWTATDNTDANAYNRAMFYLYQKSLRQVSDKRIGMAVRCVMN